MVTQGLLFKPLSHCNLLLQVCRAPVRNRATAVQVAVRGRTTAVRVVAYR
jgi:hypothetical protein